MKLEARLQPEALAQHPAVTRGLPCSALYNKQDSQIPHVGRDVGMEARKYLNEAGVTKKLKGRPIHPLNSSRKEGSLSSTASFCIALPSSFLTTFLPPTSLTPSLALHLASFAGTSATRAVVWLLLQRWTAKPVMQQLQQRLAGSALHHWQKEQGTPCRCRLAGTTSTSAFPTLISPLSKATWRSIQQCAN